MIHNIAGEIFTSSHTFADRPAIIDQYGKLSYKAIIDASQKFRDELIRAGVKPREKILLQCSNDRFFIIAILAVLGAGAVAIPLPETMTENEFDAVIHELTPHAHLRLSCGGTFIDADFVNLSARAAPLSAFFADPAIIRFTSGTTGKSKGVLLSHHAAEARISAAFAGMRYQQGEIVLFTLPMAYHFVVSILLYLKYGMTIVVPRDTSSKNILEAINRYQPTVMYGSPLNYTGLLGTKSEGTLGSLQRLFSTSIGLSESLADEFYKRFTLPITQVYGLIEVGLPLANFDNSIDSPGSIGKVLPEYSVKIVDNNGEEVPVEQTGRLMVSGPGMFDGYVVPLKLREEVLIDGWFLTGDYASATAEGIITVSGREKSVISVAGHRVFPEEIEDVIGVYPGVKYVRVHGKEHTLLGSIIVAEIVPNDGISIVPEQVRAYCRSRLSNIKIPHEISLVQKIPMTHSGKIARTVY
jgi:long-chain acyl-CoA synthetase